MSIQVDYQGIGVARSNLKKVFDTAEQGKSVTLGRNGEVVIALPAELVRRHFEETIEAKVEVEVTKEATWLLCEKLPFHSEGKDFDSALDDMVLVLREYAEDWEDHLFSASNHADYWGLVQLIKLSTDEQLKTWLEK